MESADKTTRLYFSAFIWSSLRKIGPPGLPVVLLPTFSHALVILRRHVGMHEIHAGARWDLAKSDYENGVRIGLLECRRAPGLHDHFVRHDQQVLAAQRSRESGECSAGFAAHFGGRSGCFGVLAGIHIHFEQCRGRRIELHGLLNSFCHGSFPQADRTLSRKVYSWGENTRRRTPSAHVFNSTTSREGENGSLPN